MLCCCRCRKHIREVLRGHGCRTAALLLCPTEMTMSDFISEKRTHLLKMMCNAFDIPEAQYSEVQKIFDTCDGDEVWRLRSNAIIWCLSSNCTGVHI